MHDYTAASAAAIEADTTATIAAADRIIASVVAPTGNPTYDGTLGPLEEIRALLGDCNGRGAFLGHAHPDAAIREAGTEAEERLTKYGSDLVFDHDLYRAVREFAASAEAAALNGPRRRLLDHWMRDFRRAGHELDGGQRAELKRLQDRLIELQVRFAKNLAEYDDHLDLTRDQLGGLPDDYIARLRPGSTPDTFRVSMEYPEYMPFMEQATDRELRRRLQFKFLNRAAEANRPLLEEAIRLREQIAALLEYPSWAHFAMEVKMAHDPERVEQLYAGVLPGLERKGTAEFEEIAAMVQADHPGAAPEPWDYRFYHNVKKKERFGFDPNEVAEYFPLEQVVDGMFDLTAEVFGLRYRELDAAGAWHPDVALYAIDDADTGETLAHFYADLFPREGKYGHAAAFDLVPARREPDGSSTRPVSAILANFTKPTAERPSLLQHHEVVTLFHEFGHILHNSVTTVDLPRFSGFNTEWDFVEAPSQIMEHWTWQAGLLRRFARHHESGAPIPAELVDQLVAARDLDIGLFTLRQVYLGRMDLDFHGPGTDKDLDAIYRRAHAITMFPLHEGTFFPAGFGHLMGGYDAGYYGYLWAKVYGDDMFSRFEEEGITDPEVGRRYRTEVLAAGGARDPMEHLRAFLGREPNSEAFLRYLGIEA